MVDVPNTPGSTVSDQKSGGATLLEIEQQPDTWRQVADQIDDRARHFLTDVLDRPNLRVILVGAGTSAFGGQIIAPALRRHLGRRVDAVATTDIVSNPRDYLDPSAPTLLVSFARSGNSPESVAATTLADDLVDQLWHLILTCDPNGALALDHAERSDSLTILMPEQANDTGFAMTSSITSMMVACLSLLGDVGGSDVEKLARAAERVIAGSGVVREIAQAGHRRFVYLGSGALQALARESALKMLELTTGEVDTYPESPLGFRHGPKSVLDDDTLVIAFVSTDQYTSRYDVDIIGEIRTQLGPEKVLALSTGDSRDETDLFPGAFDELADLEDSLVALAYLVVTQYLALFSCLRYDKNPDNPFPGGEVNRVVQGVTIYPFRTADTSVRR